MSWPLPASFALGRFDLAQALRAAATKGRERWGSQGGLEAPGMQQGQSSSSPAIPHPTATLTHPRPTAMPVHPSTSLRRRAEPTRDPPAPTSTPSTQPTRPALLLPAQPWCGDGRGGSPAPISLPPNPTKGRCHLPPRLGTAQDRHRKAKSRLASIAVFIFHSKASHADFTDTLSRQPPDIKAFFKTI